MTSFRIHSFYPQFLVALLVTLGLLCSGMRVPDLSAPHRPKPTHRTLLKTQVKTASIHLQQFNDLATVSEQLQVARRTTWFHAVVPVTETRYFSPQLVANSGRSPPTTRLSSI